MTGGVNFREHFYYDESVPSCLRYVNEIRTGNNHCILKYSAGSPAGSLDIKYYRVTIARKRYKAHRVVWELHNGSVEKGMTIDHINGNPIDNRIENLRCVTLPENARNLNMSLRNKSGVTGVSLSISKNGNRHWKAPCNITSKKISFKSFSVMKYGEDGAFQLACEYREKMIVQLNEQGAGYTEDHGTRRINGN